MPLWPARAAGAFLVSIHAPTPPHAYAVTQVEGAAVTRVHLTTDYRDALTTRRAWEAELNASTGSVTVHRAPVHTPDAQPEAKTFELRLRVHGDQVLTCRVKAARMLDAMVEVVKNPHAFLEAAALPPTAHVDVESAREVLLEQADLDRTAARVLNGL